MDPIFATKVLKYLEPEGEKQKNKKKAGAGELFASLTPAKLAQIDERRDDFQLLANRVTNFAHAK